jgi:hypothetical protein
MNDVTIETALTDSAMHLVNLRWVCMYEAAVREAAVREYILHEAAGMYKANLRGADLRCAAVGPTYVRRAPGWGGLATSV